MVERPDVDAMMAGPLGDWLQVQAQVRDAARAKSNSRLVVAAFILLPALAFLWFVPALEGGFKGWISAFAMLGAAAWVYAPRAKAIRDTKHGINAKLAEALGVQYAHDFEPGTGFERAKVFGMVPTFHRSSFEDLWSGDLAGHPFSLHEAHLKQRRSSGKRTRYVTVFRGPIMTIGFARKFHGATLVTRQNRHRKFGFFGEKDTLEVDGEVLQLVEMVHPDFEDVFSIYSTDQVEARYLVHPTYVEKLIALEEAFSGKDIRTLFAGGELTVVLEAKNMFESGSLDASRDRQMVETCVDQFMSMAELAATLNEPPR